MTIQTYIGDLTLSPAGHGAYKFTTLLSNRPVSKIVYDMEDVDAIKSQERGTKKLAIMYIKQIRNEARRNH